MVRLNESVSESDADIIHFRGDLTVWRLERRGCEWEPIDVDFGEIDLRCPISPKSGSRDLESRVDRYLGLRFARGLAE